MELQWPEDLEMGGLSSVVTVNCCLFAVAWGLWREKNNWIYGFDGKSNRMDQALCSIKGAMLGNTGLVF